MTTLTQRKAEKELKDWLALVEQLVHQVESWAKDRHWEVHRDNKQVEEPGLGTYTVPVLAVRAPSGPVHLDPIARRVGGADGRVDLIAWPSMARMLLVRVGNRWKLKTDSGVAWPEKWSQETFERLIERLHAAG